MNSLHFMYIHLTIINYIIIVNLITNIFHLFFTLLLSQFIKIIKKVNMVYN